MDTVALEVSATVRNRVLEPRLAQKSCVRRENDATLIIQSDGAVLGIGNSSNGHLIAVAIAVIPQQRGRIDKQSLTCRRQEPTIVNGFGRVCERADRHLDGARHKVSVRVANHIFQRGLAVER